MSKHTNPKKQVYVTTTLPYVNAEPHVGFAMEIIRADAVVRYLRSQGHEVFFNTGTDEHGMKIYLNAQKAGQDTQEYVNGYAEKFKDLLTQLNISEINFIRTTDEHHKKAAQEFWKKSEAAGDIYKQEYTVKYCVGCELEKTDSELDNGKCPLHPNIEIELIKEENYFFKFSAYAEKLLAHYKANPEFVIPEFRFNEIKAFVERGLKDFSISRLKSKMPWGVEVPGDPEQVMYVWFDALINYISAIGWPTDMEKFNTFWPVIQFAGKDNLRQQSAMWQAMLMSADIEPSKQIVINGFVTGEGGIKMSKSIGNVISPVEIINEYGTDALRYFVIREVQPFEDSPFTRDLFFKAYNSQLSNGIGNTTSRILKMAANYDAWDSGVESISTGELIKGIADAVAAYELNNAMGLIMAEITKLDQKIQQEKPFEMFKQDPDKARKTVAGLVSDLSILAKELAPFMPETSEKILASIADRAASVPLFPRKP
ncbi:MAG TPA: methionine--tRNA ligase [Candidatus Paceibacterota bacterium]|nr:methionine--tRNA ligase [Candidatus Paceibacterota bacterium]